MTWSLVTLVSGVYLTLVSGVYLAGAAFWLGYLVRRETQWRNTWRAARAAGFDDVELPWYMGQIGSDVEVKVPAVLATVFWPVVALGWPLYRLGKLTAEVKHG